MSGVLIPSVILGIALVLGVVPTLVAWRLRAISLDRAAQLVGVMVALLFVAAAFVGAGTFGLIFASVLAIPLAILLYRVFRWYMQWLSEIPPDALRFGDPLIGVPTTPLRRRVGLVISALFALPLVVFLTLMALLVLKAG